MGGLSPYAHRHPHPSGLGSSLAGSAGAVVDVVVVDDVVEVLDVVLDVVVEVVVDEGGVDVVDDGDVAPAWVVVVDAGASVVVVDGVVDVDAVASVDAAGSVSSVASPPSTLLVYGASSSRTSASMACNCARSSAVGIDETRASRARALATCAATFDRTAAGGVEVVVTTVCTAMAWVMQVVHS